MSKSVYDIIEAIGTSTTSWEEAAENAVSAAGKTLDDLRLAEVVEQDFTLENGRVTAYRVRLNISFKYHRGSIAPYDM